MKKIIALILATIMVMLAVAACGGGGTANTTEGTKNTTTEATTTTEEIKIPDPVNVIVYYTMGENPIAINLATNESAGKLTAAEGVELVQGNFYVAEYYNGASKALVKVGTALSNSAICVGLNIIRSEASPLYNAEKPNAKPGGNWLKDLSAKKYDTNMYMDTVALNTALGEYAESIGQFGTMKVITADNGELIFTSNIDGELNAADINVKFAYIAYDGTVIKTATNKEAKTPIANAVDIIRYANDMGNGKEAGWTVAAWQGFVDNYGLTTAKYMCTCEVCQGAINLQTHWLNITNPSHVAVNWASALANYNKTLVGEATLKANMDAAKAALDAAVAAKADDALNALKAAAEAEGATDEAKTAYTTALNADEALKPLNTAYTDAKKVYDNIEAYTTAYNTQKPLFEKFCAGYEDAADLVLWDSADIANSYLYKQLSAEDVDVAALGTTFTYYYDFATDTYTVYVTSMFNANVSTRLS